MGSQSKKDLNFAYIAGFLDGDGSLMLQLKKRSDTNNGLRFMATICFYQDQKYIQDLKWIQNILKSGYISKRNDGMVELRINGFAKVYSILEILLPHIRFKKLQAKALFKACNYLKESSLKKLNQEKLLKIIDFILIIQKNNYGKNKKN